MTFDDVLEQVIQLLKHQGRVSYRALKRRFALDNDYLEDLKEELIHAQRVAIDEDDRILVWTGDAGTTLSPVPQSQQTAGPSVVQTDQSVLTASPPTQPRFPDAERRQVTVLFADISGFTALAETLDPEEVRQLMNACFTQLVPVVEAYGGTIDKFIGDEIMALFGAPIAHENDAERAVCAALAMQETLATFNTAQGTTLGLHSGLNTGLVIAGGIGTQSRQDYSVMGDAVNLAARLEDASERGQIFVGPETYHLTRTRFRYEPLAPMTLKGKTDPVQVYQVLGLRDVSESHETDASTGLPLVGRTAELTLLLERWAQATQGLGHMVVLSGEAGMGKSRLAAALGERVVQEGHLRLTMWCSPYHTHSALYPITTRLARLLQGPGEESATARVERLEELLRPTGLPLEHVVPLFAALLSVPLPEGRYTPLHLSPQHQRQQTLEALVTWLVAEAARQPILSVWEDLHWADPSTLELLQLLLRQVPTARLLLVVTCRPPFQPPWGVRSSLTPLMLSPLGQPQMEQLVSQVTAGKALPPEVLRQVIAGTDGVPLFVEECVKMILESPLLREEHGQYVLTGRLPPLAIPATLQDTLMARLDHLASVKTVAQLGATLGREFTYALLAAVSPLDEPMLQHGLAQLVDAELLYQRGHLPQAQYIFKHALIQEVAYQSLLRSTRQQYHQRIAQVLEAQFAATVETQPELLAYHYTEADLGALAMPYWRRAGQRALERSANAEAVSYLRRSLEVLRTLPDTPEQAQEELALQMDLGVALSVTQGFAAPDVAGAYSRAHALCQQVGDVAKLFPVLYNLWNFYLVRSDLRTALEATCQLAALAEREQDVVFRMQAHNVLGQTQFQRGEVAVAHTHLEHGIALYDPQAHRSLALVYGEDPGIGCRVFAVWTQWLLGHPEQSLRTIHALQSLAEDLAHPYSWAQVLFFGGMGYLVRRDVPTAAAWAERQITLCREQDFALWLAGGLCLQGWVRAAQGQWEAGIAQMRQALADWHSTGAEIWLPFLRALLAEAYVHAGQIDAGLSAIAEALDGGRATGEHWWDAELYRLQGEGLQRQEMTDEKQAEACFHQALAVARQQQAKSLELRAVMSLARLWWQQDRRAEARELLAPIYGWFTEGFDTADLQDARVLLEGLA